MCYLTLPYRAVRFIPTCFKHNEQDVQADLKNIWQSSACHCFDKPIWVYMRARHNSPSLMPLFNLIISWYIFALFKYHNKGYTWKIFRQIFRSTLLPKARLMLCHHVRRRPNIKPALRIYEQWWPNGLPLVLLESCIWHRWESGMGWSQHKSPHQTLAFPSHLHSLQVENCDSNSWLVVDEDANGKARACRPWAESQNHPPPGYFCRPYFI